MRSLTFLATVLMLAVTEAIAADPTWRDVLYDPASSNMFAPGYWTNLLSAGGQQSSSAVATNTPGVDQILYTDGTNSYWADAPAGGGGNFTNPSPDNLAISNSLPEIRLVTTGSNEYARWTRNSTNNEMLLRNRILVPAWSASGGDSTNIVGDYTIHTFTSTGTAAFACTGPATVQWLIVAGGGGGAQSRGGGGGAGGMATNASYYLAGGSYAVVVGAGGSNEVTTLENGENSTFDTNTVLGGGKGGFVNGAGASGGSGGGSSTGNGGGAGTAGQGNNGGAGAGAPTYGAGGGGGAGAVGAPGTAGGGGGNGGIGLISDISGTPTYYAGGGGGAVYISGTTGLGGLGGGGDCSTGAGIPGGQGTNGTGGGGGAATCIGYVYPPAGIGGSGIVIVRYLTSLTATAFQETTVVSSKDGVTATEQGIQTYGDTTGRTVIEGSSLRYNVVGVEQMRLDDGVLTPTTDNDLDFGSDALRPKNIKIAGSFYVGGVVGKTGIFTNGIGGASTTTVYVCGGVITNWVTLP